MSASVRGRACSLEEAVAAAAAPLSGARLPLVFGLVDSTVEAQREAVRRAWRLRAVIDPATSSSHAAASASFARSGALTTTLGEMRRQADLVVFWGFDPDQTHPDFMKMYSPARAGRVRLASDLGSEARPARHHRRGGSAGERAGVRMIAGPLVVAGDLGHAPGLLKRGTLVAGGRIELLPTFRYACTYEPGFLRLLLRSLEGQGFAPASRLETGRVHRYGGDFTELGRGEILQGTNAS